ncbi:MAG: UDP-N-acetylmuramoyl-L-alanine--D-glutamate ligase, partial [bacterium]
KGKSTTSSLIHQILLKGGKTAILIGNIGTPALDELSKITKNSLVVFELSCHQLSHLKISPHIAVILGIFPEHLDYYETFSQYLAAKSAICKYQNSKDSVIYYAENKHSSALASSSLAEKIPIHDKDTLHLDSLKPILIGKMNRLNMAIAIKVSEIIGINPQVAIAVCRQFNPLPHRLEDLGEYQQIRFINDSLATVPQATIQALDAFKDQVETLILGGHDRYVDYTPLARVLLESKVRNLIFFPPVGNIIWELLNKLDASKAHHFQAFFVTDMKSAIEIVYKHTTKGKICLLSPGASSFSNFRDYQDRGNQFKNYVKEQSHS